MLSLVRQSADDTLTYSVRSLIESYTEEVLPLATTIVQNLVRVSCYIFYSIHYYYILYYSVVLYFEIHLTCFFPEFFLYYLMNKLKI